MNRFATISKSFKWSIALLLGALAAGCGGDRDPILGIGVIATLAPTVTAAAPTPGATGVATNILVVTADFSEPMNPITGAATFTVTCALPCVSPTGTVTLNGTSRIATFTLGGPLDASTTYTGTITGATSIANGQPLAVPYVWTFTTGLLTDATRPRVTITQPATTIPGPTLAVPTNTAITAVFTEDMAPLSIDGTSFTVTCVLPCVNPVGVVTYSVGSQTAVFLPGAPLDGLTTYTATITQAATDLALNALGGNQAALPAASDYIWTFTTLAAVPPSDVSVLSTTPAANALLVCPDASINATFDIPSGLRMDPLTITGTNFIVVGPGPGFVPVVASTIVIDVPTGTIATFTPSTPLVDGDLYTVTIKGGATGVKDLAIPANEMLADFTWTFTAGPACALPSSINMGLAATFASAATAGVTNTPTAPLTLINGDVVLDPNFTCNAVSADNAGGFGLCGGSPPTINGQVITPTFPAVGVSTAIKNDLNAAFLSITPPAGPPAVGSLAGGVPIAAPTTMGDTTGSALVLGDNYFTPGVWISGTSILISNDITLDALGDPNAEFFFQSASTLTTADGAIGPGVHTRILLVGGAKASNVWWQVASSATLGNFTEFNGNVLAAIDITMKTGATSCGRLMAGSWVGVPGGMGQFVFDSNVVSVPGNGCPP